MKIGIYGGTFNPIHLGHMEAARFALEYLALDRLYLIPTGIPPHKRMGADAPEAAQRLEMVRLAAEALGLGSLIIGCVYDALRGEKQEYFSTALKLPQGYEYEIAIALGHKAVTKEPHTYEAGARVTYL